MLEHSIILHVEQLQSYSGPREWIDHFIEANLAAIIVHVAARKETGQESPSPSVSRSRLPLHCSKLELWRTNGRAAFSRRCRPSSTLISRSTSTSTSTPILKLRSPNTLLPLYSTPFSHTRSIAVPHSFSYFALNLDFVLYPVEQSSTCFSHLILTSLHFDLHHIIPI